MRCLADIERLDRSLALLAREEAVLRMRLGQLLEVMGRGAVFDLGFSSLGAYAVERCERSVRWAEGARCLARRVEALPQLRLAMAVGKVSWSMGELLARVATSADEARWLELAESRTVRQMRVLAAEASTEARKAFTTRSQVGSLANLQSDGNDGICTLTYTVAREDAWLFEATRCLLEQLGVHGAAAQTEALLAEAQSTLLALLPEGTMDMGGWLGCDLAQQPWVQQRRRGRDEAEASCENDVLAEVVSMRTTCSKPAERRLTLVLASSLGIMPLEHASCTALDQEVRAMAAALARHELEVASLALRFHRAGGWRTLGYATETEYARESLGMSRSSLLARRTLALRLEKLPGIAAALGAAQIGVEAALQLVRIATPKTEAAWIERARRRTIKHLREEVAAALTAVRMAGESDCPPPEETEMAEFQALEQAVVSGRFGEPRVESDASGSAASASTRNLSHPSESASDARRAWCVMLGNLASWLDSGCQTSAAEGASLATPRAPSGAGRVTLRLRMSRETYVWWRALEAHARCELAHGVSWLRFLCLSLWHAWRHLLGTDVAYSHIYIRDRFRCMSPVCNRRDVTPHHLEFRSAGGSDEDHNVASACTWCHLHGIHGGKIRALGTADHIRWELGPRSSPCLIVHGRDRVAA
jgi:hypothetical protein